MKVLIAGGRDMTDPSVLLECLCKSEFVIDTVICGYDPEKKLPKGVDELAYNWAITNKVNVETYPADWTKYGKSAGPRRNKIMVGKADALIAIWDGFSPGTSSTIKYWKQKASALFQDSLYNCKIFKYSKG